MSRWNNHLMGLATLVSQWSKDPSTKVGAVIADSDHCVRGLGYNGFPRGVDDSPERYADRETKYKMIVHSETNAILNSRSDVRGCTMYTTKFPCSDCAKLIIQSGITELVYPLDTSESAPRWAADAVFSRTMFRESGVTLTVFEGDQA